MTSAGKLVRDRIPEIVEEASGVRPRVRMLESSERLPALFEKLGEEADELRVAATRAERTDEIADLFEVLLGVAAEMEVPWSEVERRAEAKRIERGGFESGYWMEVQ